MAGIRNVIIQFGMIQAQVSVQKATEDRKKVSFNQTHDCLDKATGKPGGVLYKVDSKTVCSNCKLDVPRAEITSGYQVSPGNYIPFTDAEKDAVKVATNGAIIINEVIKAEALLDQPFILTGQSYFLTPPSKEKYPPMAFAVIRASLGTDIAMARTSMYNQEYTCAIRAGKHGLLMDIVRYPSEMRTEPTCSLPIVDPSYIVMATQFKENLRVPTPKLDYPDLYNEGLAQSIANKVSGLAPATAAPAPAPVPTSNIEAMLKAMVEAGKPGFVPTTPLETEIQKEVREQEIDAADRQIAEANEAIADARKTVKQARKRKAKVA